MKFLVRTPTPGYTGEVAGVAFAKGAATVDGEQHRQALAYFRRKGYGVDQLDEDTQPAIEAETAPSAAEKPARDATKRDWVTYAVEYGQMTREDAEKLTRDQLAEKYLGKKED